jgi:flagellar protein FlaG
MNEVRSTQVTPAVPMVASAASSDYREGAERLPSSGKELPLDYTTRISKEANQLNVDESKTEQSNMAQSNTEHSTIEQAVTEINEYVQSVLRDLHFSVDEDSGQTVVRVRDKESGELIRQIPEDIFLNLAQNLKDNQPIHLFDAHG